MLDLRSGRKHAPSAAPATTNDSLFENSVTGPPSAGHQLERTMVIAKTAEELWEHALSALKPELKEETFELWLRPLSVTRFENGLLVLRVPNRFFSDWIKTHYQARVEQLISDAAE